MEWIDRKIALPKNRTGVIATNGELVGELYYDKDKFQHAYDCETDEWDDVFIDTVTHWMPLPKPPEAN